MKFVMCATVTYIANENQEDNYYLLKFYLNFFNQVRQSRKMPEKSIELKSHL